MKNSFKPFSDNLVFFDTEFSGNDFGKGELLSVGMIDYKGKELYIEIETKLPVSEWVKEHVLPVMTGKKVSKKEARKKIEKFVGKKRPYLISHVIPYDTVYLHKLFNKKDFKTLAFHPWPIDITSVFFALGKDPDIMKSDNLDNFAKDLGIDTSIYKTHNALDDARLLREVYLKMVKDNK